MAFGAWAKYAQDRVWQRGAQAQADAQCGRGLLSRAFGGWREVVWHGQLMRASRRALEAEGCTPLQLRWTAASISTPPRTPLERLN